MPIELYPFRFRDPLTGKWVRARYVAELHEIAARYAEWEIIGPPEIRTDSQGGSFTPWPRKPMSVDTNLDQDATPDRDERRLVLLFLRRYVTYRARRRRCAEMHGAARLYKQLMPA
jgi:hypothetical protein